MFVPSTDAVEIGEPSGVAESVAENVFPDYYLYSGIEW
jgi:hypothetical protein